MDDIFKRAANVFDKHQHKRDKRSKPTIPPTEEELKHDIMDIFKEVPIKRPRAKLIWQVREENRLKSRS